MYRMAVCGDSNIYRENVAAYINRIFPKDFVTVFKYSYGDTLLCDVENMYFDILLLDISMPEMRGITMAEKIRESRMCGDSIIIFISSCPADTAKIVDLKPFAYIFRTNIEEKLEMKLKRAVALIEKSDALIFVSQRKYMKIRYQDIIYIEADKNSLIIHTNSEVYVSRSYSMNDVCKKTASSFFIRCHQSFLVNDTYIKSLSMKEIEMYDGALIPVSKKYRSNVMEFKNRR